jgi:hypothetical protein
MGPFACGKQQEWGVKMIKLRQAGRRKSLGIMKVA